MSAIRFAPLMVVLGLCGLGTAAFAQGDTAQDKSLFQRLDDFGKSIFGVIVPNDKAKEAKSQTRTTAKSSAATSTHKSLAGSDFDDSASTERAGSILSGSAGGVKTSSSQSSARPSVSKSLADDSQSGSLHRESVSAMPVRRQPADSSLVTGAGASKSIAVEEPPIADTTENASVAASTLKTTPSVTTPADSSASQTQAAETPMSGQPPLYERLRNFRHSAFTGQTASSTAAPAATAAQPASEAAGPPAATPVQQVATRPVPGRVGALANDSAAVEASPKSTSPSSAPAAAPAVAAQDLVLFARKGPILSVETLGPRRIAVGKASTYEVNIINAGEVAAEDLLVFVSLPTWAEIAGVDPTVGKAQTPVVTANEGIVQWHLGHLNAKSRERLVMRVIPRQSKPFDFSVRWEYKPVASQALIEVQEPKLELSLEGPQEVLYGKKEVYRLKIANNGTGAAENVAIMLMPLGTGENTPAAHKLGLLPAGERKTLDVELTARQTGNLTIQVDVRAAGGIRAALTEKVLVRRANLKIDVSGPQVQFVGSPTSYVVQIRNSGTAMARNIHLTATLPQGAKYISGVEQAQPNAANQLEWTLAGLSPEAQQTYSIQCNLGATGTNHLEISATADDDLQTIAATNTRVESVANLVMDVKDPMGPVAVGSEAVYEMHVRNRGTKEAENVEVFAYFSRGIEPQNAEGAPHRILTGQVIFQPIAAIAPGAELTLRVRARAEQAGNHTFRAEVHCKPLGARLISEATNLYYLDGPNQQLAAEPSTVRPAEPLQTVDRSAQPEAMSNQPRK